MGHAGLLDGYGGFGGDNDGGLGGGISLHGLGGGDGGSGGYGGHKDVFVDYRVSLRFLLSITYIS